LGKRGEKESTERGDSLSFHHRGEGRRKKCLKASFLSLPEGKGGRGVVWVLLPLSLFPPLCKLLLRDGRKGVIERQAPSPLAWKSGFDHSSGGKGS